MTGYVAKQPPPFEVTDQAACRGVVGVMHGVRHVSRKGGTDWSQARRICASCPVREACLAHALAAGETDGMWGGKTPEERSGRVKVSKVKRCATCGLDFTIPYTGRGGREPVTCSEECHVLRDRRQKAEAHRERRGVKVPVPCAECERLFERERNVQTCSAECHTARQRRIWRERRAG